MLLYTENPKNSTRKLQDLHNEVGEFEGYKINAQESLAFLHTNNKIAEREMNETILLTITKKNEKNLGINLNKERKDLYK